MDKPLMYSVVNQQIIYNRLQKTAERVRQLDRSLLEQPPQDKLLSLEQPPQGELPCQDNKFSGTTTTRWVTMSGQ